MINNKTNFRRFLCRFTITHVVTYTFFGILFMLITDYFSIFEEHDLMNQVMRPSDSIWVRTAVLFQFVRGALLALGIYQVRHSILDKKNGWFNLFVLMWILTGIGAVITGPGSIEGFLYTNLGFGNPLVGLPEITIQMLVFSFIFTKWMDKKKVIAQHHNNLD